jgi:putative ABC transport system permease protein
MMLEIKPIFNALRRSKAGALMLLIQIAITTAIVSNAAFIIKDKIEYLQQETGYPEDGIFSFGVLTYGKDIDLSQMFEEDETMLRNTPGVIDASLFSDVPVSGSGSASSFHLDADPTDSKSVRAAYTMVDDHGLNTLGVKVSEGRAFTAEDIVVSQDRSKVPTVGIVTKAFLEEMFPDGDGLGNTIYFGPNPLKIIGVVEKMKGPWLRDRASDNVVIFPMVRASSFQNIVVRTNAADRSAILGQIEDLMLAKYDKRVVVGLQGMDDAKDEYNAGDVLMMRMLVVLIVVLVLVTALGIFGLTVFNINKRTKQIGTRRALGARKSAIVSYFLVENAMVCFVGLLLGTIGALLLGQALFEYFSLPELDYLYIVMTAIFVLCFSLLSVILPANKAANISPSIATRSI